MAQIGWIDFSKTQRDQVTAVLDMLKPEGKVDELGIGIVRDNLADILFPGISTIQTRAKYFYIVTNILWQYFHLPATQKKKKSLNKFLDEKERLLMYKLRDAYNGKEGEGVIGITKKDGESLTRYPSTIYWNGLAKFGFINYNNYSLGAYLNRFSKHNNEDDVHFIPTGDDSPIDDLDNDFHNYMGLHVMYDKEYENLHNRLELTSEEAEDFSRRIRSQTKGSLLSELLNNKDLYNLFITTVYDGRQGYLNFAPRAITMIENEKLRRAISIAHDFSLVMYGAHVTYNQLIQLHLDSEYQFEDRWEYWVKSVQSDLLNPSNLDSSILADFVPRIKSQTLEFIKQWFLLVQLKDFDSQKRFSLVESQEYNNKRYKARIRLKKLDDCKRGSWLGFDYLDYRYGNAKIILNDIKSAE